ncbi:MAG: histone deacetylase [Verrucomicrobia bacterium]|nr:histone deacetylase [Verrucomicrobiota bacterium]
MNIITDERCTAYAAPGHPERPARISRTLEKLRAQNELALEWAAPLAFDDELILRAHSREHLKRLDVPMDFDGDTPAHPNIAAHARRSVGGALQALALARKGQNVFSLLRPPGHHAMRDRAMGFCYLNSIAIAALEAHAQGFQKICIYDFDVHHGNGTEAILTDHPHCAFFSIHQHPCYPGTGTKNAGSNCFNYPVAPRTPRGDYRKVMQRALDDLKKQKPDLVCVSAGFDAYAHDPLAQETLEAEDYHWLGQSIRGLGVPALSVLEGGYSNDLPDLIFAYLKGLEGK